MIEDELIKIWQSSNNQERLKFEKSKLMIEMQSSLERLHRWWKFIALLDIVAALIAIPAFTFIAFWVPFTTSKFAAVLIIIYMLNILIRLLGIKKFKPSDLEGNYLEYLNKTRRYLEIQKNLLVSSVYWAYLPIYPILLLFLAGLWEIPSKRPLIVIIYLAMVAMSIYGYFLNKSRVKNEINPRIERVDELIENLKE